MKELKIVDPKTGKKDGKKESRKGSGQTRQQVFPIYKVNSGGVTIEFTDRLSDAQSAFKDSSAHPKYIWKMNTDGNECIDYIP